MNRSPLAGFVPLGDSDLEIQHRLAFGIVLGFDDLPGIVCIGGAQTGAFASLSVHAVVCSTTDSTADETVTCFHSFHATARITQAESEQVADSGRITPDYSGFLRIGKLVSVLVSVADALPLKPLLHSQFGLEARVGIGRVPPSTSHSKSIVYGTADALIIMHLRSLSTITPPLFFLTRFSPFKTVFAGTFAGTFFSEFWTGTLWPLTDRVVRALARPPENRRKRLPTL